MGLPIFYSPYLSFSLHQERKSGFLTPTYGSTSGAGRVHRAVLLEHRANRDATLSPRILAKRGVQLNTEFRYLDPSYRGEMHVEYLPNDNLAAWTAAPFPFNIRRRCLRLGGSLNLQRVSDDRYFTDLATLPTITSQVVLPREGSLGRGGTWVKAERTRSAHWCNAGRRCRSTRWRDHLAYSRQPQLTLTAYNQNILRGDLDFIGNFVDFNHPTLVNGKRYMAYPV